MRSLAHLFIGLAALVFLFAGVSCTQLIQTGSVELQFDKQMNAMTLVPDISMEIQRYEVTGVGPLGSTFTQNTETGAVTIPMLMEGNWTITVDAFNGTGNKVGTGSASTTVVAGMTVPLSVTVRPLEGTGTVSLVVAWPAGVLSEPSVVGSFISPSGTTLPLNFDMVSDGNASVTVAAVEAGYHTMVVQLKDYDEIAAGAVAAVRVATGATTTGGFAFDDPKRSRGASTIIINPDMDDLLTVLISGGHAEIGAGQTMTLSASVVESVGTVVYTWYLDGVPVSTGSSYTASGDLLPGTYRADVIAFNEGGTRSGSAHHVFTVLERYEVILIEAEQFTIVWDPPGEGEVAATQYNLYFRPHDDGNGSWMPLANVSGDTTSYTVTTEVLSYGVYDLAVTSVDTSANESEIHSSLDPEATPSTGWYVDWRAPV